MARSARVMSESGFYHVITRGVGRQILFEDEDDRTLFMTRLVSKLRDFDLDLFAWCLMSNHVHLLLRGDISAISSAMCSLESSYALYFNKRHDRTGTLFQGRFTSVPINTDEQLCSAVRYIHLNPVKAGGAIDTPWSSYSDYLGIRSSSPVCVNKEMVLEMLGGSEGFARFHEADDAYQRLLPRAHYSEDEAVTISRQVLGGVSPYEVRALDRARRDEMLKKMYEAGLSSRQICRITSLGRNIVERATR